MYYSHAHSKDRRRAESTTGAGAGAAKHSSAGGDHTRLSPLGIARHMKGLLSLRTRKEQDGGGRWSDEEVRAIRMDDIRQADLLEKLLGKLKATRAKNDLSQTREVVSSTKDWSAQADELVDGGGHCMANHPIPNPTSPPVAKSKTSAVAKSKSQVVAECASPSDTEPDLDHVMESPIGEGGQVVALDRSLIVQCLRVRNFDVDAAYVSWSLSELITA
jgi:hypothetical protein